MFNPFPAFLLNDQKRTGKELSDKLCEQVEAINPDLEEYLRMICPVFYSDTDDTWE